MDCIYCNTPLPDKGFFCPTCSKQNKCKHCNEMLVPEAKVCVYCGEATGQKTPTNGNFNTIEFTESENSRTFKAMFTDTVGQSISDSFALIISNKVGPKRQQQNTLGSGNGAGTTKTEEVEAEIIEEENSNSPELNKVKKIFKDDGEKTTLQETRMKAKSKRDYGKRLALVFLYYKSLLGMDNVPRKSLNAVMEDASVADGNFRYWLANNPQIGISNDMVQIKAPGKDAAKKIVEEIFNPEIKDKWQIGTTSRSGRKKDKKEVEK